ncbi:MAG: 1-acyl-sn-glycerol-3-phosphate acyltransferase [Acidimicrobiales bacterium]
MRRPSTIWVPPRWIRVLVITPIVFLATGLITFAAPLLHLVLALIDIVDRKEWRFTRMGGLGIALCIAEFLGLIATLVLWIAAGFGWRVRTPWFQRAHNMVFGWWLELVTRALRFYLGFEFVLPLTERIDGPILTFARHAGPGDAFLLAHTVIRDYRRQLRMLGTNKLLWDPFINHMMLRLPNVFLEPNPHNPRDQLAAVTNMCSTMGDDSVVIIFPEGGNWTPGRWKRSVETLEGLGQTDRAERAANMANVLPPRSAAAAAALGARDDMTVVFVVHEGLDDLYSLGQIWRNVPLRRTVNATYWSIPAHEIPVGGAELTAWLYDQWAEVDQWIASSRPN